MADGRLVRVKLAFERDYTQIPNEWLRDNTLSLKARGLLALLMSHNENFTVTHKHLTATNPEGRAAIQTAVDELKQRGYLSVVKERGRNGRIDGWVWTLTDPKARKSWSSPHLDLPALDNPALDKPYLDSQHLKEAHLQEHLTKELNTGDGTGAWTNEDALTRAAVQSPVHHDETPEERYNRLLHQPCPYRPAGRHGEHARHGVGGACIYCGIGPAEYFDEHKMVQRLDEVLV